MDFIKYYYSLDYERGVVGVVDDGIILVVHGGYVSS
jgi:hypothetical protein